MKLAIHDCIHCGTQYTHQCSGSYDAVDTPREYRDKDYCPDCKKVIFEALSNIPKKFEYKFVVTDEVNLETLLRWEKEEIEDAKKIGSHEWLLPKAKRIFASVMNQEMTETMKTEQVIGREDKKGRRYIYSYWPSKPNECRITVEKKVNLITGEELNYKI